MPLARLNGIHINYEVHGEGTPIVLAHGYTASIDMWREQVPALSATHRLVIYDTRGHGATTAPADMEQYRLARDYVGDQLALMDHLRIDKAIIGGLSMGGMIAQEFALQHPDRVKALLLFDTGPGMAARLGGGDRDPAIAERFRQMRALMQSLARTKGMSAIVEAMRNSPAAMSMGRTGASAPDAVRRHLANMRNMSVDGYLGGAKAMQDWPGTLERLHTVAVPTLVLVGEFDQLLPASAAIHSKIADSRFVLLKDAGHGTNMWRAGAFIEATTSFLDDLAAGRPIAGEITVP